MFTLACFALAMATLSIVLGVALFRSRRYSILSDPSIRLGPRATLAGRPLIGMLAAKSALVVEVDTDKSLPLLLDALQDPDPIVRYAAAGVLASMGGLAAPAIGHLRPLVGNDPLPGDRAAEALARIGSGGIGVLIELLSSADESARTAAATGLALAGEQAPMAIGALSAALSDERAEVRRAAAIGALGEVAGGQEEPLRRCLNDDDVGVRLAARKALTRLSAVEPGSTRFHLPGTTPPPAFGAYDSTLPATTQPGGSRPPVAASIWRALPIALVLTGVAAIFRIGPHGTSIELMGAVVLLTAINIALQVLYQGDSKNGRRIRKAALLFLLGAVLLSFAVGAMGSFPFASLATAMAIYVAACIRWPVSQAAGSDLRDLLGIVPLALIFWLTQWIIPGGPLLEAIFNGLLGVLYVAVLASRNNLPDTIYKTLLAGLVLTGTSAAILNVRGTIPAGWQILLPRQWLLGGEFSGLAIVFFIVVMAVAICAALALLAYVVWSALRIADSMRYLGHPVQLDLSLNAEAQSTAAARHLTRALVRGKAYVPAAAGDYSLPVQLDPAEGVPILVEALHHTNADVRYLAAQVLGGIGGAAAPSINCLTRMVGGDLLPQDRAAEALIRIGSGGVEALIALLQAQSESQRVAAAMALGLAQSDNVGVICALTSALDDPIASVRGQAVNSLAAMTLSNPLVRQSIQARLDDTDILVRLAARKALAHFGTKSSAGLHQPPTQPLSPAAPLARPSAPA